MRGPGLAVAGLTRDTGVPEQRYALVSQHAAPARVVSIGLPVVPSTRSTVRFGGHVGSPVITVQGWLHEAGGPDGWGWIRDDADQAA